MARTILNYIKNLVGLVDDDHGFDLDICTWANSGFMTLRQLGVGPKTGFSISPEDNKTWDDYDCSIVLIEMVKAYIVLYVTKSFDPPTSSILMDAIDKRLNEYEFRLNIEVDGGVP